MRDNRGSWYLLTGLLIGLVIGVIYTWVFRPVQYVDTAPASLRSEYKDRYRAMIALAYVADGDLVRAKARLSLLHDPDIYTSVAGQAQRWLAAGVSPDEARALGLLAVALGQGDAGLPSATAAAALPTVRLSPTVPLVTATAEPATETLTATRITTETLSTETPLPPSLTPTPVATRPRLPTATPSPSFTPTATLLPTRTVTPTPGAPFVLEKRDRVCEADLTEPLLQIFTYDASGEPVPSVEIIVTWDGGEEHIFTGLKPELGLEYADFTMKPEVVYNLRLAEGGQPITDLSAFECAGSGGIRYWGSWRLTFVQP